MTSVTATHRFATPLRYPGGKQKLTPFVAEILAANGLVDGAYAEPYAGGAGVAVELLVSRQVSEIHLNDINPGVHAFWTCVKSHNRPLCELIASTPLSVPEWRNQKAILNAPQNHHPIHLGFALLYVNRVNRSGILNGGLIGGKAQVGKWLMDARFNRQELIRRVTSLGEFAGRIHVYQEDAVDFIALMAKKLSKQSLVYLDPPYYEKGNRLYQNYYKHADHVKVRDAVYRHLKGRKWMCSYDNKPEIHALYPRTSCNIPIEYDLQYSAARAFIGKEFMAFSDALEVPKTSSIPAIAKALEIRASLLADDFPTVAPMTPYQMR